MNRPFSRLACWLLLVVCLVATERIEAADNELTAAERKAGWKLLFDGRSFDGWMTSDGKPSRRPIEQSAINPHRSGAYMMVHKQTWTDFRLKIDFKISPRCNSGISFRSPTSTFHFPLIHHLPSPCPRSARLFLAIGRSEAILSVCLYWY